MPALPFSFHALRQATAVACVLASMQGSLHAQQAAAPAPVVVEPEPMTRSALDEPLFYQLVIGELELLSGRAGAAYQIVLDAARKTRDEALFRRTVQIALQARAGTQALEAVQAWRTASPDSREALLYHVQLLVAVNRLAEALEPMRSMLRVAPADERNAVIASLPRLVGASTNKPQAVELLEQALQGVVKAPETRVTAGVALGRAKLAAGDSAGALELAQRALTQEPGSDVAALLALELMGTTPAAEALVTGYLAAQPRNVPMRLMYARVLSVGQRYAEAATVLGDVTRLSPQLAPPWLTLGALHLELKRPKEATAALTQYLQRVQASTPSAEQTAPPAQATELVGDEDDQQESTVSGPDQGRTQAYLLLAQAAEQQRDFKAAEAWLAKITNPQRALDVQSRRATLLAQQGKLKAGRELIRRVPETSTDDARAKLVAEAHLLREMKQWGEASTVLKAASQKFPNDVDLLYEQSMMAEKLNRMDEMERLLRRVIEQKPDHHHAYNALGYSLADRNQRLPEARELIKKALELAPGEPFITDSLGWVEYRLGNRGEALRLLQQAYRSRPDVEIAVHLGEVLWVSGQREEARRVLREARERDASNDVLREAIARLKVDL